MTLAGHGDSIVEAIELPTCLALVFCKKADREPSGRITLHSVVHKFIVPDGQTRVKFDIYTALTNGHGCIDLGLRLADSNFAIDDNAEVIYETQFPVEFPDPLFVFNGVVNANCVFRKPGIYHCELFSGDQPIISRRFKVIMQNSIAQT